MRATARAQTAPAEDKRLPVAMIAPATALGGIAELYAAARAAVPRLERTGGMAELYRDQAAAARRAQGGETLHGTSGPDDRIVMQHEI